MGYIKALKKNFKQYSPPTSLNKLNSTGMTKCKYCGREYIHTMGGPVVTIQKLDMNAFKPELKFVHHNARQPLKCESCGADVLLVVERIIPKTLKTDRESLYI